MNQHLITNFKNMMSPRLISLLIILLITLFQSQLHFLMQRLHKITKLFPTTILFSSLATSLKSYTPLGCIPITISKGVFPILLFIKLLNENSTCANTTSQLLGLSPTKYLNKLPKLLFTTSICRWM